MCVNFYCHLKWALPGALTFNTLAMIQCLLLLDSTISLNLAGYFLNKMIPRVHLIYLTLISYLLIIFTSLLKLELMMCIQLFKQLQLPAFIKEVRLHLLKFCLLNQTQLLFSSLLQKTSFSIIIKNLVLLLLFQIIKLRRLDLMLQAIILVDWLLLK